MKKKIYETPSVSSFQITLEQGIAAASATPTDGANVYEVEEQWTEETIVEDIQW